MERIVIKDSIPSKKQINHSVEKYMYNMDGCYNSESVYKKMYILRELIDKYQE